MSQPDDRDTRLMRAAEEYFALLDRGEEVDKKSFLARHADIQSDLGDLIDQQALWRLSLDAESESVREARAISDRAFSVLKRGSRIARYTLEEEVGRGGMGVVWSAKDEVLDETVALKFLPPVLAADKAALRLLRQEAKVLLALTHIHIVRLRTIETAGELSFLVMEFLRGRSLQDLVDERFQQSRRGLSAREALWVLEQIVPALEYAHGEGITHRDLKPANLLFDRPVAGRVGKHEERLKVADFGLAFVATSTLSQKTGYRPSGTLLYMAPEVLLGAKPTPAADIYSLGTTLYALMRGSPPFTHGDVIGQILNKEPDPLTSNDAHLDAAIRAAMSKKPQDRPTTPAKMLALARGQISLAEALRGETDEAPHTSSRRWKMFSAVVVGVTALVVALAALQKQYRKAGALSHAATATAVPGATPTIEQPVPTIVIEQPKMDADGVAYTNSAALPIVGRVTSSRSSDVSIIVNSEIRPLRLSADGHFATDVMLVGDKYRIMIEAEGVSDSLSFVARRDNESPTLEIASPAATGARVASETVEITGIAHDLALRSLTVGDQEIVPGPEGDWRATARLVREGTNELQVVAADAAGNVTRELVSIERDTTGPVLVSCLEPTSSVAAGSDMTIELQSDTETDLALQFNESLSSLVIGSRVLEIGTDGRSATLYLRVPVQNELRLAWTATDTLKNASTGVILCRITHPSRWPRGWDALDLTRGTAGWARRVRDPRSGVVFLLVDSGSCQIGSPEHEGESEEQPQHVVTFDKPFYLAEHETTIAEWRWFVDQTKFKASDGERETRGHDITGASIAIAGLTPGGSLIRSDRPTAAGVSAVDPSHTQQPAIDGKRSPADMHPVTQVSWADSMAFCKYYDYRLPFEVEWEYACRSGCAGTYWWGDVAAAASSRANVLDAAACRAFTAIQEVEIEDGFALTAAADDCLPNPWGFKHMLGNVWEWCADEYDEDAYDLFPLYSSDAKARTIRGGSWRTPLVDARCAKRAFELSNVSSDIVGFRAAFDPEGNERTYRSPNALSPYARISRAAIVRDEEGVARVQGKYRRVDSKGVVLTEGDYQNGKRHGTWFWRHPNNRQRSRGSYKSGLEHGAWRWLDETGASQEEGEYERGWRKGRWSSGPNGSNGVVDYGHVTFETDSVLACRAEGSTANGMPDGIWRFWWPNGQKQLQGQYANGRLHGLWLLWHADGTPETLLVSGRYEDDVRVSAEAPHAWVSATANSATIGYKPPPRRKIDLGRLTPVPPESDMTPDVQRAIADLVRVYCSDRSSLARDGLLRQGVRAVPVLLEEMRKLSPEANVGQALDLQDHILFALFRDHSLQRAVRMSRESDSIAADEARTIACWHSLWNLVSRSRQFMNFDLSWSEDRGTGYFSSVDPARQDPLWFDPSYFPILSPPITPGLLAARAVNPTRRSETTRVGRSGGPTAGTEKAILEGLRWLCRHQQADGSWSAVGLSRCCDASTPCFDAKMMSQSTAADVGLTGLAVLCILRAGAFTEANSDLVIVDPIRGTRRAIADVLGAAVRWLLDHQDRTGKIAMPNEGPLTGHASIKTNPGPNGLNFATVTTVEDPRSYSMAIATMALCEASRVCRQRTFRDAAQTALDYLAGAQRPSPFADTTAPDGRTLPGSLGGWGYNSLQDFENLNRGKTQDSDYKVQLWASDLSNTTWAIMALKSGKLSGLEVKKEHFDGALDYVSWLTPLNSDGFVGYIAPNGAGAEVIGTRHDLFNYHKGVMSSLGMCVRMFCAQDPNDPFLERAAKQIVIDMPIVTKDSRSIDYYYWYFGSLALNQFDGPDSPRKAGKYWSSWNKKMIDAVLQTQNHTERSCSNGGWTRMDRWARTGGPIYSTAMNILTLETCYMPNVFRAALER